MRPASLAGGVSMRIEFIRIIVVMYIRRFGNNLLTSSQFHSAASFEQSKR